MGFVNRLAVALVALALLGGCERDGDLVDDPIDMPSALHYRRAAHLHCRQLDWSLDVTDFPGGAIVKCVKRVPPPGRGPQ